MRNRNSPFAAAVLGAIEADGAATGRWVQVAIAAERSEPETRRRPAELLGYFLGRQEVTR